MALASPVWRAELHQTRALAGFAIGLLVGALSAAAALLVFNGLLSPLPLTLRSSLFLGASALAMLREVGVEPLRFPQSHWQVPREVFARGVGLGSVRFGLELGLGFRTYVTASSAYVLASGIALLGVEPLTAVAAATGFAVGRATPPWLRYWNGRGEAWDEAVHSTLRWFKPLSVPLVATAMLMVSFVAS